jgi:carbamoyl-phosphate synthase large subunit
MDKKLNVLVTGCGGDIGQSIGKILKEQDIFNAVLGADLTRNHAGIIIFDSCFILPRCDNATYLSSLQAVINNNAIDLLIPVSEAEVRFFYDNEITEAKLSVKIIIANREALAVGLDKLATSEFLKNNNLPYPKTGLISLTDKIKLPCIVKSRNGAGSKNVFLAKDDTDINYFKTKFPDFIVQEFLENATEEYTCGLYRSSKGETRNIIFRRTLLGGFSGYGEVVTDSSIEDLLNNIAVTANLQGSINVQLRLSAKGPCVFEINPRFSSTVRFRDMFGFKDVLWSIQDKLNLPIQNYTPVQGGKKFYKGFSEYIS